MIKIMENKGFTTFLICTQLCLMSSTAHTNESFNYLTISGGSMHTLNDEEQLLLYKEDDASFEKKLKETLDTIDYFSNNYPYTVEQLENYYGIEFYISNNKYKNDIEIKPRHSGKNIHDISIRSNNLDSQLMIINPDQTTCYNYNQLKERLLEEGYEINLTSVYYIVRFNKVKQVEDILLTSSITVSNYKHIDLGCIAHYAFDYSKIT